MRSVIDTYQSIMLQASDNVLARNNAAAASPHVEHRSSHETSRFGVTYSWVKIFKMTAAEREKHVIAMQNEIDKLLSNGHARWESLPPGEIALPSVGVFCIKQHDLHSGGYTLKARFCANGQAIDPPPGGWESAAQVASCSQILTVVAIAAQLGMQLAQIDVKSAFTQVKLRDDERIWIKPLPGLGDPERKGRVLRLVNHLYGHPLANAAFQERWVQLMKEYGFTVIDAAKTVFAYERGKYRLLVATVVDDSIVAFNNRRLYNAFKEFLN